MSMLERKRLSAGLLVTLKVFVRSRNGLALKVVREHYLRDDIPCYSRACSTCREIIKPDANGNTPDFILSSKPTKTASAKNGHYLVIDTNIVLRAIDLLENELAFYDVIIPQTVLDEVKTRSYPIYHRLRALVKKETKRFVVFHNEFFEATYVTRKPSELLTDRNERAIGATAKWYSEHLKEKNIDIIFVRDSGADATTEGVDTRTLLEYINDLSNADDLRDLVPADLLNEEQSPADAHFPDYYSNSRVMAGIKNGTLYQGMLNISQHNILQGQVSVPQFKKPLLILGSKYLNRAFNSDAVYVELLPQDQWKEYSHTIVEEKTLDDDNPEDDDSPVAVVSDRERQLLAQAAIKETLSKDHKLQPTARVVGVQRRSWRYYVGQIDPALVVDSGHAARDCFVILMDKQLPKIKIRTRKAAELVGQRIVVVVDLWPELLRHPHGHFVRSLGAIESAGAETEALLLEHDVEYRPFSKNVLDCLPEEGDDWKVPDDVNDPLLKGRVDLRDKLVCLIDPPSCVDIDDALHAKRLPNGNFEVGVHIADVTHFVKANTALDQEGAQRGTSVYLVDKRIDMLPMLLGTNLCSLKPYVDRFAFSVIWELDEQANIVDVKFMKLIIRSREAFSYERAQNQIDDKNNNEDLTQLMRYLLDLSRKLKQQRVDNGALNLASPEVKVYVDLETSDPNEVEIKKPFATNSLVEEFMLLANISVARKIYEAFPQTAMLRRHAAPPSLNFEELNEMLRVRKDMTISLELSKSLADSLDRCEDPKDPYFNTLLRIMLTRCMMAAEYFALGMYGQPEFRHYGLAVDIYTHFTSPIRRYCDVVAHRQLAGAIGYENLDLSHRDKGKMELIVRNINRRHRNAQFAGRASIDYYVGQVMRNNEQPDQEGYVIKCFNNGIVVLVPKFGVEGLIKLDTIGDVALAEYDEEKYELLFTDLSGNRRTVGVFDKVNVEVKLVKDDVLGKRKAQLLLK